MDTGRLGVWYFTETMSARQAAEAAQRIEQLGYGTLWIPETTGRNPMAHAAWLLANTQRLNVATGIANLYPREPGVTVAAQNTLAEQSGASCSVWASPTSPSWRGCGASSTARP